MEENKTKNVMEENKKEVKIKVNHLYLLRELCEAYQIEYLPNRTSRCLKKLMNYIEVEKQSRSHYYLVKEIKIKPEEME